MEAVDELISFHGGVSQQDVSLRLPQQVESSNNCYHTIESGVRRRNPTNLVKTGTSIGKDCWTYEYDRGLAEGLSEKYSLSIDDTGLKVLDLETGDLVTVVDNSNGYLLPFISKTGYSAVTVKDTTFIANRNKLCSKVTSTLTYDYGTKGYGWIKRVEPVDGYDYTITIKNDTYPSGTSVTSSGKLTTSSVCSDLVTKLNALTGVSARYSDNIIEIESSSLSYVSMTDSYGGVASGSFFMEVSTENDLPSSMPYETIIEVSGSNDSAANYWLKSNSLGTWEETIAPNTDYELDAETMPYKIERKIDIDDNIYFEINEIEWNNRIIGDNDNSEEPSFIDSNITDIFFFNNRLGLLTPTSMLFSEVGEYYNFWKTTQVTTLDSDRIDFNIDSNKAIRLHYVKFLQNDMIVFGDKTQFVIEYSGTLTTENITAKVASEYDFNYKVEPLEIDNKIFFTALNNEYTEVFVYSKDIIDETNKAQMVTTHVPYYLDSGITEIVGSSVNSTIFLITEDNKRKIYVYKYLEDNNKLIQSAWFTWDFTGDIHSIFSTEGRLYLLITRDDVSNDNDDWILHTGAWNNDGHWYNNEAWIDDLISTYDNVEYINIIPQEVSDEFLDNSFISYTSDFTLSEYLPLAGNNKRISDKINLKTIYVKSSSNSKFNLKIENTNRNISRTIDENYSIGRKPYIMGKAKDTRISISSNSELGFEINGVAYEARINNRSRSI